MIKIYIDNKDGNVWDISSIVSSISWRTYRRGKPSTLEFTLIKNALFQSSSFKFNNGDIVRFEYNNQNVFYGFVFNIGEGKNENVSIRCYDQTRILNYKETYVFSNLTVTEMIRRIADDFNLQVGTLQDTGYVIPSMVEDNQKILDIIEKGLTLTLINSDQNFIFYDDFGFLTLRNVEDTLLDFYLGDDSLIHDYQADRSIDQDTYNRVKVYQDNEETGRREVYIAQDSANIARWGILQLVHQADENMNEAQIRELVDMLITLKNRETRTLKLNCIGDIRVRAGSYVPVVIREYDINQPFLVDSVAHRWDGNDHQMEVELRVI